MGFEPTTPTLARLCSTPELRPRSIVPGFYAASARKAIPAHARQNLRLPRTAFHGLSRIRTTTSNIIG
jgi:hypothetical protein